MYLTIGELSAQLGVATVTLRRWEKRGSLMPSFMTPGGHRRYDLSTALRVLGVAGTAGGVCPARLTVAYARVSSHDQKDDLKDR